MTQPRILGLCVRVHTCVRSALLAYALLFAVQVAGADEVAPAETVLKSHRFLGTAARGRDILSYVHFGATYRGHGYKSTHQVQRQGQVVPGHFALVYTFSWEQDGATDVAFLCDHAGNVYEVQVLRTNAVLQQPFLAANATIKTLGNLLIEAFANQLTDQDRRQVRNLVENANAQGMLTWALSFQQRAGL